MASPKAGLYLRPIAIAGAITMFPGLVSRHPVVYMHGDRDVELKQQPNDVDVEAKALSIKCCNNLIVISEFTH